jgi:micrococcal nuclease
MLTQTLKTLFMVRTSLVHPVKRLVSCDCSKGESKAGSFAKPHHYYSPLMITQTCKVAIAALVLMFLTTGALAGDLTGGMDGDPVHEITLENSVAQVKRVVDGDTLELVSGQMVRLLGIDTPERGEPMADLATDMLKALVGTGSITLLSCTERDRYGRLLSVIQSGGVNVNLSLVKEGVALPLLIPPCGIPVAEDVLAVASEAARAGKGLYSGKAMRIVSHLAADTLIGERAMVQGKIVGLFKGPKAWHLNFGDDYRTDFTAVLFSNGRERYRELGVMPESLVGSEVLVIGKVKSYNGPEIIVNGPGQIIVLGR